MRLSTQVGSPVLPHADQLAIMAQLRDSLEIEEDDDVRADLNALLGRLRSRPDLAGGFVLILVQCPGYRDGPLPGQLWCGVGDHHPGGTDQFPGWLRPLPLVSPRCIVSPSELGSLAHLSASVPCFLA